MTTCAAVTPPGGASCTGAIDDLGDLVDCVACVSGFSATCMDRAQVPKFEAYPVECRP